MVTSGGHLGDRMDDLSARVRHIRRELRAIAEQLNQAAPEVTHASLIPEPTVAEDLLALKAAVDEMRAFLWAYFEAARQAQVSAEQGTQPANLDLTEHSDPEEASKTSFFEKVQSLATTVVEKHMMGIR
jgi:hypothetical protein